MRGCGDVACRIALLFSERGRKEPELLSVFGDGAPGDLDAFLGEELFQLGIAVRFVRIFCFNESSYAGAYELC